MIIAVVYTSPNAVNAWWMDNITGPTQMRVLHNEDFDPSMSMSNRNVEMAYKLTTARKNRQSYILMIRLPSGEPPAKWTSYVDKRARQLVDALVVVYK